MNKSIATLSVILLTAVSSLAQTHQPTLEDCKLMFQDYYYLKDWEKAKTNLEFIIQNSPNEEEKYYIKGVKVYEKLIKSTKDKEQIKEYQQKALDLYQQRFTIYGKTDQIQNQFLSSIYRYWINQPVRYDSLNALFQERFDENLSAVSQSNMLAYFDLMRRAKKYKQTVDEVSVLANYDNISRELRAQGDEKGYVDKIDKMLLEAVALNCDKIGEIYGQRVTELDDAKRYLNMVFKMDCEVNEKAEQALAVVLQNEPEYKLAMYAAKKSIIDKRLRDAQKYLGIALQQAQNPSEESDAYLELAKTMTLEQKKQEAHKYAKLAISKSSNKEAYKLIGNLYMSSFTECIGEKDIVARRAVFIAAYDKFKMANDTKGMATAAAQFPSMEEIHSNLYELGQPMVIDCWFKEEVILAKRVATE